MLSELVSFSAADHAGQAPKWCDDRPARFDPREPRERLRQFLNLSSSERDLLALLMVDAGRSLGYACRRQSTYARMIGRTSRTIQTYYRKLEAFEYIWTVDRLSTHAVYVNWRLLGMAVVDHV